MLQISFVLPPAGWHLIGFYSVKWMDSNESKFLEAHTGVTPEKCKIAGIFVSINLSATPLHLLPNSLSFIFLFFTLSGLGFFLCPHLQLNGALGCSFLHFHPSERQTFLLTSSYRTITQATSWNWYSRQIRLVDLQRLRGRRSHTRINFPDCSVTLWFRLSSGVKPKRFCFGWWLLGIAF